MIEKLDLGQQLPRLDSRKLRQALTGGLPQVLDEIALAWNVAMREIEDRLNREIGEKINHVLELVNTDVAYFGVRDSNGNWRDGAYRVKYEPVSGELKVQRYLGGSWVDVHRFYRDS